MEIQLLTGEQAGSKVFISRIANQPVVVILCNAAK